VTVTIVAALEAAIEELADQPALFAGIVAERVIDVREHRQLAAQQAFAAQRDQRLGELRRGELREVEHHQRGAAGTRRRGGAPRSGGPFDHHHRRGAACERVAQLVERRGLPAIMQQIVGHGHPAQRRDRVVVPGQKADQPRRRHVRTCRRGRRLGRAQQPGLDQRVRRREPLREPRHRAIADLGDPREHRIHREAEPAPGVRAAERFEVRHQPAIHRTRDHAPRQLDVLRREPEPSGQPRHRQVHLRGVVRVAHRGEPRVRGLHQLRHRLEPGARRDRLVIRPREPVLERDARPGATSGARHPRVHAVRVLIARGAARGLHGQMLYRHARPTVAVGGRSFAQLTEISKFTGGTAHGA